MNKIAASGGHGVRNSNNELMARALV